MRLAQRVLTLSVIGAGVVILSYGVTVGSDTMWLVALGNDIASHGAIPVGVPFLDADTSHWVNVPVLGELVMAGANALGAWGLVILQLLLVVVTLVLLAITASRLGAGDGAVAVTLFLFVAGSLSSLGVVRAQTLSLPCFAALLLLLRREQMRPSRLIWLVPAITLVWGNLHGGVLMGVAVAGCHLLFFRARREPWTAMAVGLAIGVSLWVTPGGLRSHVYYWDVLNNAAAKRGEGLWAPLSLVSVVDIALVCAGLVLLALALAGRLPLWEYVAVAGLLVATGQTSRHGVWLLMLLVPHAARHLDRVARRRVRGSRPVPGALLGTLVILVAVGGALPGIAERAGAVAAAADRAARLAVQVGSDQSTLAPSPLAEFLAVAGVRLWAANPIDALPQDRQAAYLDFLADPARFITPTEHAPQVVVLRAGQQPPAWIGDGYRLEAQSGPYVVYSRAR